MNGNNITEQEIQKYKNKLIINNTHNIDEETSINNEIKNESEFLSSLLNIKRNELNQQNIQNNVNNIQIPNIMNNNIQIPNMMNINEEWLEGFQMGINEFNNEENNRVPKMNTIFKTTQGITHTIVVDYGTSINELLEKYLKRVGRPDLIGDKNNKFCALYYAVQLKFGDKTKVESFFKMNNNSKVVVNYFFGLIGPLKDVTFKTTFGKIHEFNIIYI